MDTRARFLRYIVIMDYSLLICPVLIVKKKDNRKYFIKSVRNIKILNYSTLSKKMNMVTPLRLMFSYIGLNKGLKIFSCGILT